MKFKLVFCSTRIQPLAGILQRKIDEYLDRLNDSGELAAFQFFDQAAIHRVVADQGTVHPIELELFLYEWGKVRDPYLAYHGQVNASEVASWHETHGTRLFEKNLRKVIDRSDVNSAIGKTLEENPDRLVYFNNGIVALCDSIEKKPLGGDSRDTGCFVCRGVSVVNGAQTVGAIAQAARMGRDLSQARVFVRLIATTNCPQEFAREVTRATNTQNRIERQDFAALDPQQARLKSEMSLDGKQYAYKTGENPPPSSDGCTLVDATIALAFASDDAGLAVQAKREVGKLWEDIERPPYRLLFNASLTSTRLWRCVEVMRAVDEYLESSRAGRTGRDRLILVHGNRFILRMVFLLIPPDSLTNVALDAGESRRMAIREVSRVVEATIAKWNELFENAYPANLFKNLTRCRQLESAVVSAPVEYSGTLFPDSY